MGEGEKRDPQEAIVAGVASHLLSRLGRLENDLERVQSAKQISELQSEFAKWKRVALDRFADRNSSGSAEQVWRAMKSFETMLAVRGLEVSERGEEAKPSAGEPPKILESKSPESKSKTEETAKPALPENGFTGGNIIEGDDEVLILQRQAQALGVEPRRLKAAGGNVRGLQKLIARQRRLAEAVQASEPLIQELPPAPPALAEVVVETSPLPEPAGSPEKQEEALPQAPRSLELSRLAADVTYHFLDDVERLKPKAGQSADERFLEVSREVWRDIVYEGKFDRDGNPRPLEEQDLDVRVSMFLLQKAGFKRENLLAAEPERPGELVAGKINIDRGGRAGVGIEEKLTAPVEDKYGAYLRPTVFMDNHPRFRPGVRGSSAHGLYELLREGGFFEKISEKDRRALEMMVQLTIDDDNAAFPESAPGKKLADFERSGRNFRGLVHYLKIGQIYDYFQNHGQDQPDFAKAHREAVVARELTEQEINKYGLKRPREKLGFWKAREQVLRTPLEDRQNAIEQARERLSKSREELLREGTIAETRLGTYVVDFVEATKDKLLAGHQAVQAYGYDGYIVYDLRNGSFLINNMGENTDLSKDENLQKLAAECGAVTVRGAMIIKPPGLLQAVKFRDALDAVGMQSEPVGKIKDALRKPIPLEDEPGYRGILKRYFKKNAPEMWKSRFSGIGLDGHFRDQNGQALEKSFIPVDEWEKIKAQVRAESARQAAERAAARELKKSPLDAAKFVKVTNEKGELMSPEPVMIIRSFTDEAGNPCHAFIDIDGRRGEVLQSWTEEVSAEEAAAARRDFEAARQRIETV